MWEKYYSVSTIEEALSLLDEHRERARIIAGGTDILIELEQGNRPDVDALIDITRVADLDEIRLHGGNITLGALVNHNHIVASDLIQERALPLAQASWLVGAPQIRNRATVAGNLITASPANDTITPLMALGAEVTLSSVDGERTIPLASFYTGLRQTVMRPNEMLTAISFPAMSNQERGMFIKLGLRRAQAISVVNTAVLVRLAENDRIESATITLGSVAPTIIHAPVAEKFLQGKTLDDETIREAARLAGNTPSPIDDVRSTAQYRQEMVKVLVARALRAIAHGTYATDYPQMPAMLWGDHEARVHGNAMSKAQTHDSDGVIETTINHEKVTVKGGTHKTLLRWLREDAQLIGTKEGCAEGECGACTVFLDGVAVMSCMVPAPRAHGAEIVTVEGLAQNGQLHPIQSAFVEHGAVQCGYCTPGFLMAGAKLLEEKPQPTHEQIQQSISGNLCRCTGYYKILDAFVSASQQLSERENSEEENAS
jgi:xanthine dehydrogenase iron-sulfur cluster and FAD-binding subunit A